MHEDVIIIVVFILSPRYFVVFLEGEKENCCGYGCLVKITWTIEFAKGNNCGNDFLCNW